MNAYSTMTAELRLKPLGKKVLNYMRTRGAISPLVAFSTFGTMRLAAQIHDLREAGFDIITVMKEDAGGDKYASYRLAEQKKLAA